MGAVRRMPREDHMRGQKAEGTPQELRAQVGNVEWSSWVGPWQLSMGGSRGLRSFGRKRIWVLKLQDALEVVAREVEKGMFWATWSW